ncbi:MAG: hypothetical protein VB055_04035 [Oscillospiraceae bacterium]|nr:hypothetical protein [Oscillospiraceae bacterium]
MSEQNIMLDQEMQKKYWKKNYIWTALVLVAAAVYFIFSSPGVSLAYGETELQVTAPDRVVTVVPYADLTEVMFAEDPDYGSAVQGGEKSGCHFGTWENSAWGTYYLCVYQNTDCCIILMLQSGATVVINASSRTDTETLYEGILEKMSTQ